MNISKVDFSKICVESISVWWVSLAAQLCDSLIYNFYSILHLFSINLYRPKSNQILQIFLK